MHTQMFNKQEYSNPPDTQPYADEANTRIAEAQDLQTPSDRLSVLSLDDDYLVRHEVARNPRTPAEALEHLSQDPDSFVREQVLYNPNTPDHIKEAFLYDRELSRVAQEYLHG